MATSIDESAPEHRVGKLLADRWRIERLVGVGGVSSVFAAIAEGSGERVAIKVMHPELLLDDGLRARFLREARLAGSIEHQAVVRVVADGTTDDGAPFLVMEFLDGETIDARMRRKGGKLPVREALWIADAALDALAETHAMGVVHRDIRVENLFLTKDHVVKVLDFGVARVRREAERTITATVASVREESIPSSGGQAGTDGVADDLWAVGAAMFTMITGESLLDGQLRDVLVRARFKVEVPSLAAIDPHSPDVIIELVDRALKLDSSLGWPDARAMQRSLRAAIEAVKNRASYNPHVSSPFSAPFRSPVRREMSAQTPALAHDAHMKIPRAPSVPEGAQMSLERSSATNESGTISLKTAFAVVGGAIAIGGLLAWLFAR